MAILTDPAASIRAAWLHSGANATTCLLCNLLPIAGTGLRLWVGDALLISGLVKIIAWQGAVLLISYEIHAIRMLPEIAALAGMFTGLLFPVLLLTGLAARFAAFMLLVFNSVVMTGCSHTGDAGYHVNRLPGPILFAVLVRGPGRAALDYLFTRKLEIQP